MRRELEPVLLLIRSVAVEGLPKLLGELEEIRVTALARLTTPTTADEPEQALTAAQVADRMNMSREYVYRHAETFPFRIKNKTGRALRFSSAGLDSYLHAKEENNGTK